MQNKFQESFSSAERENEYFLKTQSKAIWMTTKLSREWGGRVSRCYKELWWETQPQRNKAVRGNRQCFWESLSRLQMLFHVSEIINVCSPNSPDLHCNIRYGGKAILVTGTVCILLDKQTGWGWMTAQLGDLTCGQASNDPWSSSLVNTGGRSQVELLGVLELLKTNELGGRKLSPAVFCLIWLLLFLKCFELEVCMKMNPDITQHNPTPQKTKSPKPDLWCFCSSVPISRGSVRPSSLLCNSICFKP